MRQKKVMYIKQWIVRLLYANTDTHIMNTYEQLINTVTWVTIQSTDI